MLLIDHYKRALNHALSVIGKQNLLLTLPNSICAWNYRPCFRENQPKRSFSIKWKRAFWACFRENWVYKFGHWYRIVYCLSGSSYPSECRMFCSVCVPFIYFFLFRKMLLIRFKICSSSFSELVEKFGIGLNWYLVYDYRYWVCSLWLKYFSLIVLASCFSGIVLFTNTIEQFL